MADQGGITVIFPGREPSTNETRIFVHLDHLPKRASTHTAELADVNVVGESSSYVKYFVTTQILRKKCIVLCKVV